MTAQFIAAMLGVWAFAVLFHAPQKYYLPCAFNGAVGWAAYLFLTAGGHSSVLACLLATLILTLLSRCLAIVMRAPVTIFLVTGIFPLVPGAGIYYTAYYLMTGDLVAGTARGVDTFLVAGAIALGILLGSILPQSAFLRIFCRRK